MARSFGDLSHAVYVPADHTSGAPKEMLFIDYWNSPQGLMQFFSNEQVQQGGKLVFASATMSSGPTRPACRASACRRRTAATSASSASCAAPSRRATAPRRS